MGMVIRKMIIWIYYLACRSVDLILKQGQIGVCRLEWGESLHSMNREKQLGGEAATMSGLLLISVLA